MRPIGSRAAICGLTAAPQYNGARCDVLGYRKADDGTRYAVRLVHPNFSGKELLVREACLEFIYALLPENLATAESVLAAWDSLVSFEDVRDRWGEQVGRALVSRRAIDAEDLIFQESPFLVVSNPRG